MLAGDQQRTHIADFEQHHFAGVVDVLGLENVEEIAAAIQVADGGDEVASLQTLSVSGCGFALSVRHEYPLFWCGDYPSQSIWREKYGKGHILLSDFQKITEIRALRGGFCDK